MNNMTDQEINIAIAEACGLGKAELWTEASGTSYWVLLDRYGKIIKDGYPNYCTDLNAMHEAEKTLKHHDQMGYISELESVVESSAYLALRHWPKTHATARQRAEAFLRTKGLWKE